MSPPALPPFTLRCQAGEHLVRLDPRRYWRAAACSVCKAPVDPQRIARIRAWLGGDAPGSGLRLGTARVTPAPALAVSSLVGALLLAAIFRFSGDDGWVGTILLFSGRWIWLLPVLGAGVLVGLGNWRWLWAPAAAAWVVLTAVMGFTVGWRAFTRAPAGLAMRVATFNVEGGDRVQFRMREFLALHQPDIVGLQECGPGLQKTFTELVQGYHADVSAGCIASRFPIDSVRAMPQSQFKGVGGLLVTTYFLRTPAGPIAYTNVHLETPRKGLEFLLGDRAAAAPGRIEDNILLRTIESRLARRWVDTTSVPHLVTGDFNLPTDSRIFVVSWGSLSDAWSEVGHGFGNTKLNGWISARIDHVLADASFRFTRAEVGADYGSDHLPLIVEVTLLAAPPQ